MTAKNESPMILSEASPSVTVARWEYRSRAIEAAVTDPDVSEWTEWRELIPRGRQTIDDAVTEMRGYIEQGYHYELRSLVVAEVFSAQVKAG